MLFLVLRKPLPFAAFSQRQLRRWACHARLGCSNACLQPFLVRTAPASTSAVLDVLSCCSSGRWQVPNYFCLLGVTSGNVAQQMRNTGLTSHPRVLHIAEILVNFNWATAKRGIKVAHREFATIRDHRDASRWRPQEQAMDYNFTHLRRQAEHNLDVLLLASICSRLLSMQSPMRSLTSVSGKETAQVALQGTPDQKALSELHR